VTAAVKKILDAYILFIVFCFCSYPAFSQNTIGIPVIVNYPKQVYNAGSQNWGIAQDRNGILYFANNDGLLTFDGNFWRKYYLPNKTKVRSIAIDNNRIYVGGQSEIGYFSTNNKGALYYTSLMPLVKGNGKDFTDVWNICSYHNHVFFRAYRKILEYNGKGIVVHDAIQWNFLGATASHLLALNNEKELVIYRNGQWMPAAHNHSWPRDVVLRAAVEFGKDSTLLATQQHGLFILHHDSITSFRSKDVDAIAASNIYGAVLLDADRVALNTNLSGCIIIDKKGSFVQRISKREGIQNNNVLSMLFDRDKNLWFGTDNGIDLVLYSNAIQQIFPDGEDRNAGYASMLYGNKLYLGLVSGAYEVAVNKESDLSYTRGNFQTVKGSKGQVWNFSVVNSKLLMGHLRGAFVIENDSAIVLDGRTGFWNFQPLTINGSSHSMLAGTYNGINFYDFSAERFSDPNVDAHFESARFVVQHQNVIWASHPFKGLYKVRYAKGKPVVNAYSDRHKILSGNHNKIFSIGGKMILVSDHGIFEYDDKSGDFIPSADLAKLNTVSGISYLKEDPYGNVWFTSDKKLGVMDRSSATPRIIFIPELTNKIQANGFEDINTIDSNNILITGENGFFHLNYAAYKKNHYQLNVLVSNVSLISAKDSLLFGGYASLSSAPSIPYVNNSLHFEAATTLFGEENTIEYSYFLEGFDRVWSEWTRKTEKDYTNIPPGKYTFYVKCRNNFDNESKPASFSFTVLPPWYRTWWAYSLYICAFFAVLYLLYKYQQRKYKYQQQVKLLEQQHKYDEEQKRLQMQYQLEISESDKKIAQLRSEKLQAEVEHKNSELATSAMNLVHKVEILTKIKEDLIHFKETAQVEKGTKEFHKIIKLVDGELNSAQEWEQFARHFDSVHTNYLKKLKEYCPELTIAELKLAAYLRLNLSTKEIAQLMNISIRGVETSRYRLRKKLGLTKDEINLYSFLIDVTK
jgi:ligand-binding sensor domain-containing protein